MTPTEQALRDALKRYGQHEMNCRVHNYRFKLKCSCGLDAALSLPAAEPMTAEQRAAALRSAEARMVYDINLSWRNAIIDEVEAHHGIGKGE